MEDYNDGSGDLLTIFDGNPQTYINWATDYYEDGLVVNEHTYKVVSDIYQGNVVSKEMVFSLVNKLEDWSKLKEDLKEIDFPFQF